MLLNERFSRTTGVATRLAVEMGWVVAGQAVGLIASVLLTKVLASRLGTEQYGRFALAMTVPIVLNQFVYGPLTVAAIRYFAAYRDTGRLTCYIATLRHLVARVTTIVVVVGVLACFAAGWWWGNLNWMLLGVGGLCFGVLQSIFALANGIEIAARSRISAAVHQAADPIARLAVVVLCVYLVGGTAAAAIVGVTVGIVAALLSQLHWLRGSLPLLGAAPDAEMSVIWRRLWTYGKYFALWGAFTSIQLSSDRWALKLFHGDAVVGQYAAALQLASVPSVVVANAVAQFFNPIVFQRAGDGSSAVALERAMRAIYVGVAVMIVLVAVSTLLSQLVGEPLIVTFASPAYRPAGAYVAPLILGLGLTQVGHMLGLVPLTYNRLNGYLLVKIGHAGAAVALNLIGARWFGLQGVCGASIVSGALYVALVGINNRRLFRSISQRDGTEPAVGYAIDHSELPV